MSCWDSGAWPAHIPTDQLSRSVWLPGLIDRTSRPGAPRCNSPLTNDEPHAHDALRKRRHSAWRSPAIAQHLRSSFKLELEVLSWIAWYGACVQCERCELLE